jgi:putative tryptophan/tyrosine transport system substrate-binding protein
MKKLGLYSLVGLLLLSCAIGAACAAAADVKVAVIWEGKAGMAKRVYMGFVHRMKAIAPEVKITGRMDLANIQEAERVFRELETSMDGIVFLRSSGAEFLATANPKIPCFIGGCNDPAFLGAVKHLDAPEGKITGVTYFIPYEKRFDMLRKLFPNAKRVGIVLQKGHPATPIDQQGTKEQCSRLGWQYKEVVAENASQLLKGAEEMADQVDVIIISGTALAIDNTMGLVGIQNTKKVPLFSFAGDRAKVGALAELAARDDELGAMLADSVVDVLVKGKPIAQVPVKMDPNPNLIINEEIAKKLNVNIPAGLQGQVQLVK